MDTISVAAEYVGFPAMIKPNMSAGARGIVKVENVEVIDEN
jgi:biotin carboxylase